ncbi:MAG: hypothetical protein IJA94_05205 [Bacilli bacterium]|nr:hypothetical protein [Bacilli bacterium]
MNKLLVKISYPRINQEYEMFIPINKTVAKILMLVQKAISELNVDFIPIRKDAVLVKKSTGEVLPMTEIIKNTSIEQGDSLILL